MAITKKDASKAKGADRAYLLAAIMLEQEIQKTLDSFANDSYDVLMKNSTSSGLQDTDKALTEIFGLLSVALLLMDGSMERGIGNIAAVKRDLFIEQVCPLFRSIGYGAIADEFKKEMVNLPSEMVKSFRVMRSGKYELSYNDRIATIEKSTTSVITNLVKQGVRDGLTTEMIAQRLDRYVNPVPGETPVRPWDVMRNAVKSTRSYVPKNVLPGSLQTNLIDVARTQAAESFRQATNRAFDDKPWCTGYRWVLSSSHPRPDVCDDYAEHGVYAKDDKPYSHNYCLCDWVPVIMDRQSLIELLKAGEI